VVVPLDTASARCLWHVSGTPGENDAACTWRRRLQRDRRVRPVLGEPLLVGKSPEGLRPVEASSRTGLEPAPGGALSPEVGTADAAMGPAVRGLVVTLVRASSV
jgi:hypothetical protein